MPGTAKKIITDAAIAGIDTISNAVDAANQATKDFLATTKQTAYDAGKKVIAGVKENLKRGTAKEGTLADIRKKQGAGSYQGKVED